MKKHLDQMPLGQMIVANEWRGGTATQPARQGMIQHSVRTTATRQDFSWRLLRFTLSATC